MLIQDVIKVSENGAKDKKKYAHPKIKISCMAVILLQGLFNVSWKSVYELVTSLHPRCLKTLQTLNFFISNHKDGLPSFKTAYIPHYKSCSVVERRRHALLVWVRLDIN